jgi:putative membrane protein
MSFLGNISIAILANAAAILAANFLVPGFYFRGGGAELLLAAAILGIVNSLVKPVVKLLSLPLIILSFGLFLIVINVALLFLVSYLSPGLAVAGFWSGLGAVIIISFINHLVVHIFQKEKE